MSSQPRIRRSISVSWSRPSSMDGVAPSLSSPTIELSMARNTCEYTLSPIRMPSVFCGAFRLGDKTPRDMLTQREGITKRRPVVFLCQAETATFRLTQFNRGSDASRGVPNSKSRLARCCQLRGLFAFNVVTD